MGRGLVLKWFDGFFLSMLATSVIVVSVNWQRYNQCSYPLHIWIVVDYATVFLFRVFMFIDNGLASGMGPEAPEFERLSRFKGRIIVISCLTFVLYPFLWAWTVVGSLWFTNAKTCLPEEGQKWGFLIWLVFSYCGLICVACITAGKWLLRRQAHLQLVSHGSAPVSEVEILFELIRVPDWAFLSVASGQDGTGQGGRDSIQYHPGLHLSPAQMEQVEKLIHDLPRFRLKGVPSECNSCPICLDEFEAGTEVRGLPCAHNFHVACIDEWLRLSVKCPHCRSAVFPEMDFVTGTPPQYSVSETVHIPYRPNARSRLIRAQPGVGQQSSLLRLQDLLRTMNRDPSEASVTPTAPERGPETSQGPNQVVTVSIKDDGANSSEIHNPQDVHRLTDCERSAPNASSGCDIPDSTHLMSSQILSEAVVIVVDRPPLDRI